MSNTKRKYPGIDVVKLYSTLKVKQWQTILKNSIQKSSVENLVKWRYGIQVGLSDAAKKNLTTEKMDIWAIHRMRDIEKAMKIILKEKYPNPFDDPKVDILQHNHSTQLAKRKRDREFEQFLQKSSF